MLNWDLRVSREMEMEQLVVTGQKHIGLLNLCSLSPRCSI